MAPEQFSKWIQKVSADALCLQHRKIVFLEGAEHWAGALLESIPSYPTEKSLVDNRSWYIYSDIQNPCGNVNKHTFKNKLGTEVQSLLFYINTMNVDALAALSGTLMPGGILFIVFPCNFASQPTFSESLFNQRIFNKLLANTSVSHIREVDTIHPYCSDNSLKSEAQSPSTCAQTIHKPNVSLKQSDENQCASQEQLLAVQQVIQVVKGHRNRPLVLTADRGRGKSSALAIACVELLLNASTHLKIVITSAHRQSLNVFFTQLELSLGAKDIIEKTTNSIVHRNGRVQFMALDDLLLNKPSVTCLLVDEAASIPLYQLNTLMLNYHRAVFSSTVHGYEGAGRSFSIKFIQQLKTAYPEFKSLHISQPIRWAEDDPVEKLIFDLCLLNAELTEVEISASHITDNQLTYTQLSAAELANDDSLLSEVFAVLVTAHYQTSPNDLRLLLDNKKLTILTVSVNNTIAGVALLMNEGKVSENAFNIGTKVSDEEVDLIKNNYRRLKNQFIPQSILTHCGVENSFDYSYCRVMRIAILPQLQGKQIGQRFLSFIEILSKKNGADFIGTSFGANQQLLNFWLKQTYKVVRLGFTKDKASGEHSALMLKPLNNDNQVFLINLENAFFSSFDYLLSDQFKQLPATLVWQIMHYCPSQALPLLSEFDKQSVKDFYTGKRQYSACVFSLHKWLQHKMQGSYDANMQPIIEKIFQKKDIEHVCKAYSFTGKKSFNQYLIDFVKGKESNHS